MMMTFVRGDFFKTCFNTSRPSLLSIRKSVTTMSKSFRAICWRAASGSVKDSVSTPSLANAGTKRFPTIGSSSRRRTLTCRSIAPSHSFPVPAPVPLQSWIAGTRMNDSRCQRSWYAEGALQLPALPIGSKDIIENQAASCHPAGIKHGIARPVEISVPPGIDGQELQLSEISRDRNAAAQNAEEDDHSGGQPDHLFVDHLSPIRPEMVPDERPEEREEGQ